MTDPAREKLQNLVDAFWLSGEAGLYDPETDRESFLVYPVREASIAIVRMRMQWHDWSGARSFLEVYNAIA